MNKYKPKKAANVVFISLICICLLLGVMKWGNIGYVVINEEIHSHISNFVLSLLFYMIIGFIWILQGAELKKVILLGLLITAANFICETVMGFMNTSDIMDAVYGTVGVIISFVFLFIVRKYGIITDET